MPLMIARTQCPVTGWWWFWEPGGPCWDDAPGKIAGLAQRHLISIEEITEMVVLAFQGCGMECACKREQELNRRMEEVRSEGVTGLTVEGWVEVMRRNYGHLVWLNENYPSPKSAAALAEADAMLDRVARRMGDAKGA
jgi:hypothetical protein